MHNAECLVSFFPQVVVESIENGIEYGDLIIEEGSPVNQDLHFDSQMMHLYVMTEKMVSAFTRSPLYFRRPLEKLSPEKYSP